METVANIAANTAHRKIKVSPNLAFAEVNQASAGTGAGATDSPMEVSPDDAVSPAEASPALMQSDSPLITLEQATQRLGSVVLAALSDQFNGSLTEVRHPDQNDILF